MKSGNRSVKTNCHLSLWFALLSPLFGVLLGVFGVFVLRH